MTPPPHWPTVNARAAARKARQDHALGFNHVGANTIPFCTCGWLGEPTSSGLAQTAGEVHLGEVS